MLQAMGTGEVVSIPIDHEAIPPHIAATVIVVPNVLCRGNGAVGSVWRLLFPESRRSAVFHFQADAAHLCCAPSLREHERLGAVGDGEPESVVWRDAGYQRLLQIAGGRERDQDTIR